MVFVYWDLGTDYAPKCLESTEQVAVQPLIFHESLDKDIAMRVVRRTRGLVFRLQFGQLNWVWQHSALLSLDQGIAKFFHYFFGYKRNIKEKKLYTLISILEHHIGEVEVLEETPLKIS